METALNLFPKDNTTSSTAKTLFWLLIHFQGEGNELAASRAGWLDGLFGCFRPVFWSFAAKANKGIFHPLVVTYVTISFICFRIGQVTVGKLRSIPSAISNGSDPEPRALCSRAASATMWSPSRKSKTKKRQTFDICDNFTIPTLFVSSQFHFFSVPKNFISDFGIVGASYRLFDVKQKNVWNL